MLGRIGFIKNDTDAFAEANVFGFNLGSFFSSLMGTNTGGAGQAEQTALQNQGTAAAGISSGISSLNNQAGMLNSPLPATMQGISGAIASGGNQSGTTGVNQNQQAQNLVNYAGNTGGTQLAGQNSALQGFYSGEMKNGLNQQTQLNAQNQLQQQQGINTANLQNSAAPGTNLNNQKQQMQNSELGQSANLAGNLAGQNQSIMAQGAQGVASTAGNLDTQTMNMLSTANTAGQGINSTALENLIKVLGLGTGTAGQAETATNAANTAGSDLFSGYGTQATNFGTQAASTAASNQTSAGNMLGTVAGMFGV
jgi:hypothetical protein